MRQRRWAPGRKRAVATNEAIANAQRAGYHSGYGRGFGEGERAGARRAFGQVEELLASGAAQEAADRIGAMVAQEAREVFYKLARDRPDMIDYQSQLISELERALTEHLDLVRKRLGHQPTGRVARDDINRAYRFDVTWPEMRMAMMVPMEMVRKR